MTGEARRGQRTSLLLTLLSTLAASYTWGINPLFLLDTGLGNTEAFAANALFTAGQVLFDSPPLPQQSPGTGARGRRPRGDRAAAATA